MMKSRFAGRDRTDLISSEATRRRFHPSLLGFHRAKHDFISALFSQPLEISTDLWYNEAKKGGVMMKEDKLGDLSMEFFVNALHLTNEDLSYRSIEVLNRANISSIKEKIL